MVDITNQDVVVIDDMMNKLENDKTILNLFTNGSHFNNESVIFS